MTAEQSNVPPSSPAREAVYAEAIEAGMPYCFGGCMAEEDMPQVVARAVIEVADAELAPLVARVAELEAEVRHAMAFVDHNHRAAQRHEARAERAEAALARVEALADLWAEARDEATRLSRKSKTIGLQQHHADVSENYTYFESRLRAALAAAGPAVSEGAKAEKSPSVIQQPVFGTHTTGSNIVDDGSTVCLCGETLRPGFGWHSCNAGPAVSEQCVRAGEQTWCITHQSVWWASRRLCDEAASTRTVSEANECWGDQPLCEAHRSPWNGRGRCHAVSDGEGATSEAVCIHGVPRYYACSNCIRIGHRTAGPVVAPSATDEGGAK